MRKKISLNNIELNPILEKEINQNIQDILEFCPEHASLELIMERVSNVKSTVEVKILLKGPGLKIYSSSSSKNAIESLVDCKRKILNQFKRHRNRRVLERRKEQARHLRDNRYKQAS